MPNKPGTRLIQRMRELGLTEQRLADAVGVSRSLVAMWISGKRKISSKHLPGLCLFLGVTSPWLMEDTGPKYLICEDTDLRQLLDDYCALSEEDRETVRKVTRSLRVMAKSKG